MDSIENNISRLLESLEYSELARTKLRRLNRIVYRLDAHLQSDQVNLVVVQILTDALREGFRNTEGAEKTSKNIDMLEYSIVHKVKGFPKNLSTESKLNNYVQEGYAYQIIGQSEKACARWTQSWELIKKMQSPEVLSTREFDKAHPNLDEYVHNFVYDYENELHNAGLDESFYFQQRIAFVDDFFEVFPAEVDEADFILNFFRAKAESLWYLGERDQAEKLYAKIIELLPNEIWGYIGWADHFWLDKDSSPEYEKAEKLLKQALRNPIINDREDGLERLRDLYHEWGKPQKANTVATELKNMR